MKERRMVFRCGAIALVLFVLISTFSLGAYAEDSGNRFNVVFVLDASGSMNDTDPQGLRYEAISQFTNLLAVHGNYLGGIVFSTAVSSEQPPIPVDSQADKDRVVNQLVSVDPYGWTNTGDALMSAVNALLDKGDPDLPSVIVFLSDGNTTLGNEKETEASLNTKAEAIQKARENDIAIYSVCLNADKSADVSEMEQISMATGGVFQEVVAPEDLGDVFNTFYNLIYGTATITIVDDVYPSSGIVEKSFDVPGIGVEEVNVIIYGNTSNLSLLKPDGTESSAEPVEMSSLTMIKITDVVPGTWRIITTGIPGDKIKINMVYNTNLGLTVYSDPADNMVSADTPVKLCAKLHSGAASADSSEQYNGYTAELQVLDIYEENELARLPMSVVNDHFEAIPELKEGVYKFKVTVEGTYTSKESEVFGPLEVIKAEEPVPPVEERVVNHPPEPVENPVEKTIYLWPFKENSLEFNLSELAKDQEDSTLRYSIQSSSFMEGDDYYVKDDVLKIHRFSLSKGAFTIRATDSGGLSCDIEVIVKSHNVGTMALIGLGIAALIALIVLGILLYIALTRPFRGTVYAQSYVNGVYKGVPRTKRRGRIKLSAFGMDQTGLDYNKSYFQATGNNFIYLVTNKPVSWNGKKVNKVRIQGGADVSVSVDDSRMLFIRFDSRVKGRVRRPAASGGAKRKAPTKRPVKR